MAPVVKRIVVKRYKSIHEQEVTLDNPTFLVGPNGSGKSNFVDALSFMADAMSLQLHAALDAHGGVDNVRYRTPGRGKPTKISIGVDLTGTGSAAQEASYGFDVAPRANHSFEVTEEHCRVRSADGEESYFARTDKGFDTNVEGITPSVEPASLCLPLVAGSPAFAPVHRALSSVGTYSIDPSAVRRLQEPDSGTRLKRNGSNAASVLRELRRNSQKDYERLCELLATIADGIAGVSSKKLGNMLTLHFTQEWEESRTLGFNAFSMSDGTLRALGILLAVFQAPSPALVVIEEPEATIHPGALGTLLDVLRHAVKNTQLIVTTHSPDVLDAEWIEDRHIRIVEWRAGATRIAPLAESSREALRERLMSAGELLRADALDAEPAPEPPA